jgi:hypothetical protein
MREEKKKGGGMMAGFSYVNGVKLYSQISGADTIKSRRKS